MQPVVELAPGTTTWGMRFGSPGYLKLLTFARAAPITPLYFHLRRSSVGSMEGPREWNIKRKALDRLKRIAPLWFDRTGVKCEHCYLMFRRRALPLSVATDRESWYDDWDLANRLDWSPQQVRSMVAAGELIARTVRGTGFRVFLVSENPQLPSPRPDMI